MDHKLDVRVVVPHGKRRRRHHHFERVRRQAVLNIEPVLGLALPRIHRSVDTLTLQETGDTLGVGDGERVHNARTR